MGANVDAIVEGGEMGIPASRNVNFDANVEGVQASWSLLDQKLGHLRRGDRQAMEFIDERLFGEVSDPARRKQERLHNAWTLLELAERGVSR